VVLQHIPILFLCEIVRGAEVEIFAWSQSSPMFEMWSSYKKRLIRDLDRWQSNGWVSEEGRAAILSEITGAGRGIGLASVLAILASVLFGFAAISFVAAHWEDVPRLGRLALLLAAIWTGYGVSGWLTRRGQDAFADAAVLFAVAMFGASIMLVSQMYNIYGSPSDGVLMWWAGSLLAGVVLRSNPALALAMILVCVWSFMQMFDRNEVHWPFLFGWALVAAAFLWQRWGPGLHLAALALSAFVVLIGYFLDGGHAHALVATLGVLAALAAAGLNKVRPDLDGIVAPLLVYATGVAFAGLFALQFIESPPFGTRIALAALTLVLLLASISHGLSAPNRAALWLGYIGFSIEILMLYWQTVGSILGTSLFFLIAALIVASLAYVALHLARRSVPGRSA
jgi:uncharacterized membrane protein